MLQFLREMLQGDVAFTFIITTNRGYELQGGVLRFDDLGIIIDDPNRGWIMVPWLSVDHIIYQEDN